MARNFSRHGCFYSDDEQGGEALLERASFYSDNSEKKPSDPQRRHRIPSQAEDLLPTFDRRTRLLDRERDRSYPSGYQPIESQLTNNSTLISQLDSDLERVSINKCVHLAKEREEMERELESYTAHQRSRGRGNEEQSNKTESPKRNVAKSVEEPIWKPQDVAIRQKQIGPSGQTSRVSDYRRACYFGNTSSPMDRLPTSRIQWDISPVTSVTGLIPTQSPWETTSPRSQHHRSRRETTEDSLTVDSSRSPVTQNTSLPMNSPNATSLTPLGLCSETPVRARSLSPYTDSDICRKSMMEERCREKNQDGGVASRSRNSYAYGTQLWDSASRGPVVYSERPESPAQPLTASAPYTTTRDPSPSSYSTLPYDHHEVRSKAKSREAQDCDDRLSSCELEREGVRARSRRSDKCLFSDSPSPITILTLVEEVESDQSQFSDSRMSESFKAQPSAPSPKMSPLQTSAILEYLSLPGFIEMSVDEPVDVDEVTDTAGQSLDLKTDKPLVAKPDVVPQNWEVHVQENRKEGCLRPAHSADAAEASSGAIKNQGHRQPLHGEARDSVLRVRFPDETRPKSPGPEKTSKQLYKEKTQIRAGNKSTDRPESRLGSRSAYTLLSAAKDVADIVSKHSQSHADSRESVSVSEQSQRKASQGSRTNNIASRISQAPVPFLKKSFSMGPVRTLSGLGQPRPFLKKSISLGSQRWEHFESPHTYISEKCYWDEFPNPDVRLKSYSLGRSPPTHLRPGPSWREYVPFRRPSMGSLERPHHAQRPLASPSYLTSSMYPPRQASISPMLEPSDPRRQATVFPESSRWSPSFHDNLRSTQYKYVPMASSIPVPQYQQWPGSRAEGMRPMDTRRGPPRSYLPRGISWPSPYYAPFPLREGEGYRQADRMMGRGGETEIREVREGARASYASQSSGRGSAGFFRQSLSITPTLLSSPETTEESERHRAEMELPERRAKR